jgi:hypothetical protein
VESEFGDTRQRERERERVTIERRVKNALPSKESYLHFPTVKAFAVKANYRLRYVLMPRCSGF